MNECENVEFKREFSDKIKKTVVAFLNTEGGEIFVGIDDNGKILGLANLDDEMLKCSTSISNAIKPDSVSLIKISPLEIEGKSIIKIAVMKGTRKPYYLSEKGLKPSGVFIRIGSSSVQADDYYIRQMIKDADKDYFDESISIDQNLTFRYTEKCFKDKNIRFGENEMRTLGLKNETGQFTNLALLCSEQNPYSIKFSVFQGLDKAVFLDRYECTGSVFEQLEDAMKRFSIYSKTPSTFSGLQRIDHPDYNEQSVREALLNAQIHRDYNFNGSILFNVFDNRVEIMSLGGLVRGLDEKIILRGVSELRNSQLAKIFYRLGYVEAYGTGIPRMFTAYKDSSLQPTIEVFKQAFNVVLPNFNYQSNNNDNDANLSESEKKIITYLKSNISITKEKAAELIEKKPDTAFRFLKNLVAQGYLVAKKYARAFEYSLKSS